MMRSLTARAGDGLQQRSLALVLLLALAFFSCRREFPVDSSQQHPASTFRFSPGDYFVYDNWELGFSGRIPESRFKNSWTVLDTGRVLNGRSRVTIVVDSTFTTDGRFTRRDSILFSFDSAGDVYQFGFLNSLIAERETLMIAPQWDRIAAFSAATGTSWTIARLDSTNGVPSPQSVVGQIQSAREYVGFSINGVPEVILSYRIRITKPQLDYTFWLTDAPASFAKVIDESEPLERSTLRELVSARVR